MNGDELAVVLFPTLVVNIGREQNILPEVIIHDGIPSDHPQDMFLVRVPNPWDPTPVGNTQLIDINQQGFLAMPCMMDDILQVSPDGGGSDGIEYYLPRRVFPGLNYIDLAGIHPVIEHLYAPEGGVLDPQASPAIWQMS